MTTLITRPLLPLLLLASAGCSELDSFLPTVSFDGLALRNINWEQADVDFVFQVDNPNPVRIGLASFSYALALQQTDFLSGDNPDGFFLEPSAGSPLVLPVDLVYENLWGTVQATRGLDAIDFGLSGKMGFDTPAGAVELPYREDGDFPALRTPKVRFKALRVPHVDLLGADLEVELGVDNAHGSTLFFDRLDFELDLNGSRVASGLIDTFDVAGDSEGTLVLPLSLGVLDLGASLLNSLINAEPLDLGMSATVDVQTPFGVVPLTIDQTGALTPELL